ncbi:MAG TPA: hypothetical protein VEC99_08150 [Clostridia bacterium]|nr:hypothetical protein [Clostridia bacterium]
MKEAPVLNRKAADDLLLRDISPLSELVLVARNPLADKLRYDWAPVKAYLKEHCKPATNNCPDNVFDLDCTHFVCHAMNKAGVFVKSPSASCTSGLCIRVNDLAASFAASVGKYANVVQIENHAETKEGDFCFIPSWFHLSKDHAMVLADTASALGARVYAHTAARCGDEVVSFDGQGCVYYRIVPAS